MEAFRIRLETGRVQVEWIAAEAWRHTLEYSPTLEPVSWHSLGEVDGHDLPVALPAPQALDSGFYRVRSTPR